ncbi:MAG: RNA polymerase sigma factor [Paraclostridium sp.]
MIDLELIDRLKRRDESALSDLIDVYGDLIYRASNKILNNKELSEECLNTVLMKIWDSIESYSDDIGLFKNWIFSLSKYTAIDMLRKEIKHSKNNVAMDENIKSESSVEDLVLIKNFIGDIQKNIEKLSEIDKEIFNQRYNQGNKIKDIAKNIGITPKAISLRIMRIKDKIKKNN